MPIAKQLCKTNQHSLLFLETKSRCLEWNVRAKRHCILPSRWYHESDETADYAREVPEQLSCPGAFDDYRDGCCRVRSDTKPVFLISGLPCALSTVYRSIESSQADRVEHSLNNLSVASRVHILEPQWNPSVESQAIGRALRWGQGKKIFVIRYVMEGTVEKVSLQDSPHQNNKECVYCLSVNHQSRLPISTR